MADHGIPQAAGAAVGTWFFMFIVIVAVGVAVYESDTAWWTWSAIGFAAVACGVFAWRMHSRNPLVSAGVWVGIALGLIHAGLCFSSL